MNKTNPYRLLAGTHRTRDGEKHDEGDVVELTDDEYETFPDKFDPVEPDDPDAPDDYEAVAPDGTIPTDYDDLQEMAMAFDGNEVNGRSSKEDIVSFLEDQSETVVIDLKYEAGLVDDSADGA